MYQQASAAQEPDAGGAAGPEFVNPGGGGGAGGDDIVDAEFTEVNDDEKKD
jgi:hypothetical protein